jgi:hypothetical protein
VQPVLPARTLPIRCPPGIGEALDSYLQALAERFQTAWGDVLDAVGLGAQHLDRASSTYPWLGELTNEQARTMT